VWLLSLHHTKTTPRFSREPFEEEISVDADAVLALYSTTSSLGR